VPEGHEIHGLALEHARDLAGRRIAVSSPQGRHPELSAVLDGHLLEQVEAYGKHLFYTWRDAPFLHIHLGLIGSFEHHSAPPPAPRQSVQLRLASSQAAADLVGATTCELLRAPDRQAILDRLGPDVLAADADPERAWQRLTRRALPIGVALLDQRILAGVGNVYRAEALFVCGIHPARPTTSLQRTEFDHLWTTLVRMLRQGVADRRINTVHPSEGDGLYVYKQPHCRRCGGPVRMWSMGVRRTYACETCQS
jgi:formamidopyrimidine-DNA glycosylase